MKVFALRKMKAERHKEELGTHRLWILIDIQYLMNISKWNFSETRVYVSGKRRILENNS